MQNGRDKGDFVLQTVTASERQNILSPTGMRQTWSAHLLTLLTPCALLQERSEVPAVILMAPSLLATDPFPPLHLSPVLSPALLPRWSRSHVQHGGREVGGRVAVEARRDGGAPTPVATCPVAAPSTPPIAEERGGAPRWSRGAARMEGGGEGAHCRSGGGSMASSNAYNEVRPWREAEGPQHLRIWWRGFRGRATSLADLASSSADDAARP
jgi:hypothetical protein